MVVASGEGLLEDDMGEGVSPWDHFGSGYCNCKPIESAGCALVVWL